MADTKITALTAISTVDPATDVFPIVDTSDTTMAASGTTKKITSNQILGAGGTAALASATITGDLTVKTNLLKVDSTNNRVGVQITSPLYTLHLVGEFGLQEESSGAGSKLRFIGDATKYNFRLGKQLTANNTFEITPSTAAGGTTFSNPVYTVSEVGLHKWFNGVTQAMTLDASGNLLVGTTSANGRLTVQGSNNSTIAQFGGANRQVLFTTSAISAVDNLSFNFIHTSGSGRFTFQNNNGTQTMLTIDDNGNNILRVPVTPPTLNNNLEAVFNLTSNTNLRISVRGSDGTTRTANITLA